MYQLFLFLNTIYITDRKTTALRIGTIQEYITEKLKERPVEDVNNLLIYAKELVQCIENSLK